MTNSFSFVCSVACVNDAGVTYMRMCVHEIYMSSRQNPAGSSAHPSSQSAASPGRPSSPAGSSAHPSSQSAASPGRPSRPSVPRPPPRRSPFNRRAQPPASPGRLSPPAGSSAQPSSQSAASPGRPSSPAGSPAHPSSQSAASPGRPSRPSVPRPPPRRNPVNRRAQPPPSSTWSPAAGWVPQSFTFDETPGPTNRLHSDNPADYLELFLDEEVLDLVVNETNRYADQQIDEMIASGRMKRHSRAKKWNEVTREEMKQFLGLMFLTGIIQKPELQLYWSTESVLATPYFGSVMSRNRFEAIWAFFHTANNDRMDREDRLFKVRRIMVMMTERFQRNFVPGEHIAIDEGVLGWRGRLSFKLVFIFFFIQ